MKFTLLSHRHNTHTVASRAEAWIETRGDHEMIRRLFVASRAEAWIETESAEVVDAVYDVASRAEAWIETTEAVSI